MIIKKILFIANKSLLVMDDPAFINAVKIAKHYHAHITVLMALNDHDIPGFDILNQSGFSEVKERFIDKTLDQLHLQTPHLSEIDVNLEIRVGIEFIEIIREGSQGGYDLTIKSREVQQSEMSSMDLHLIRKAETPFLLERHQTVESSKTIICAIDLRLEQSANGQAFNNLLMTKASDIAEALKRNVIVISCWSVSGEAFLHSNPFIDVQGLDLHSYSALEEEKQKELQKSFLSRHPEYESILVKGEPDTAIPHFVNLHHHCLLVLGTVTHTSVMGYLIGNTAENIILSTRASILTIKPPGFISPVL